MKKAYIFSVILIGLFCLTQLVFSEGIKNPLTNVNDFGQLLTKIAQGVGALIATLGTIMLIVAGILYLTSAGSPEKMGTAKKALTYAIIGIVIGLAASAIVEIIKGIIGVP